LSAEYQQKQQNLLVEYNDRLTAEKNHKKNLPFLNHLNVMLL